MYVFYGSFNVFCSLLSLQAEDLLDDILSFESSSLADSLKLDAYGGSGGANGGTNGSNSDLVIKQEPSAVTDAEMHALAKDRQKKDNHNMSMLFESFFSSQSISSIDSDAFITWFISALNKNINEYFLWNRNS